MPKLYGETKTNNTIWANLSDLTFADRELSGYLELFSILVVPDYVAGASHLDIMRVIVDDNQKMYDFKVNYDANMLPWGNNVAMPYGGIHPGRRPFCPFLPTVKLNKGRKLEFQFHADATGVSASYWVKPVGILRTADEIRDEFGIEPEAWEAQEGGINQGRERVEPFIKFGTNDDATSLHEWYNIDDLSFRIYAHQELIIMGIGCVPHANQKDMRLADIDRTILGAKYPFRTDVNLNELPFGNAYQDNGPFAFPEIVRPVVADDYLRVQIRDNGTQIPANGALVQIRGIWRATGGG